MTNFVYIQKLRTFMGNFKNSNYFLHLIEHILIFYYVLIFLSLLDY